MEDLFRFANFSSKYPPVIPRTKVQHYFPWLTAKRLANLDSMGQGPKQAYKNGRAIIYPTKAFLEWLDSRSYPVQGCSDDKQMVSDRVSAKRRGRKTKQQLVRDRQL